MCLLTPHRCPPILYLATPCLGMESFCKEMPTEKTQITPSEMFTHVILNLLVSVALEMTLLARLSMQDVQDLQARISAMKPYCNHELF